MDAGRSGQLSCSGAATAGDLSPHRRGGLGVFTSYRLSSIVFTESGWLTIFYPPRTTVIDGVELPQPRLESRAAMQLSVGAGWRFR